MRIYLASASCGDRDHLREIAKSISNMGHFIFAPCLGFVGIETPTLREQVMLSCLRMVKEWPEVLVVFYEGLESFGIWDEVVEAVDRGILVGFLFTNKWQVDERLLLINKFYRLSDLGVWLNELQENTRDSTV